MGGRSRGWTYSVYTGSPVYHPLHGRSWGGGRKWGVLQLLSQDLVVPHPRTSCSTTPSSTRYNTHDECHLSPTPLTHLHDPSHVRHTKRWRLPHRNKDKFWSNCRSTDGSIQQSWTVYILLHRLICNWLANLPRPPTVPQLISDAGIESRQKKPAIDRSVWSKNDHLMNLTIHGVN